MAITQEEADRIATEFLGWTRTDPNDKDWSRLTPDGPVPWEGDQPDGWIDHGVFCAWREDFLCPVEGSQIWMILARAWACGYRIKLDIATNTTCEIWWKDDACSFYGSYEDHLTDREPGEVICRAILNLMDRARGELPHRKPLPVGD